MKNQLVKESKLISVIKRKIQMLNHKIFVNILMRKQISIKM